MSKAQACFTAGPALRWQCQRAESWAARRCRLSPLHTMHSRLHREDRAWCRAKRRASCRYLGSVPGVGGSELPAGLAACQPQLLPQPLAALHQLQLSHHVGGDLPEPLRVQHGSGDAGEEDDDLQRSKALTEHLAGVVG